MLTKSKKHKIAQEYLDGLFKRANFRDFLKKKRRGEERTAEEEISRCPGDRWRRH